MRFVPRRVPFLLIALVLSVLAHLLVLFGHQIDLSLPRDDLVPLEAMLVRRAPEQPPAPPAKPDRPPQPKKPKPVPPETPQPALAEAQEPPVETPPPPPQPEPEPEPKVEEKVEPQPEVLPAPPTPAEPAKVAGNAWPRAGVIKYLLFGGESREISSDPARNSVAELRWEISPEGRYTMQLSSSDAKPFPSMPWFKISIFYGSSGRLIDGRFQPERYEESISVFQNIVVKLDWENKVVDFAGHRLPLQPGTLDYLSVIMQAGDPDFVERGVLSVATGRGLRQYRFESLGAVDLALPFGMTWKTNQLVGKTGNNDVRVWVATEKFNLPVQIKFIVNKVNYYLVATDVRVAKDALTTGEAAAVVPAAATGMPDASALPNVPNLPANASPAPAAAPAEKPTPAVAPAVKPAPGAVPAASEKRGAAEAPVAKDALSTAGSAPVVQSAAMENQNAVDPTTR